MARPVVRPVRLVRPVVWNPLKSFVRPVVRLVECPFR